MSRNSQVGQILICLLAVVLMSLDVKADLVDRRAGGTPIEGDIRQITQSGVQIRDKNGVTHTIPWDRIRDVQMTYRDPRLEEFLPMAEALWRARTRLERGDRTLSEPIFSRFFTQTRGEDHETALMVAEGLMRVRLARGANAAAVLPMLEVIRLRRAGIRSDSFSMLPNMFDEVVSGESLCVQLPPLFARTESLQSLVKAIDSYDALGDTYVEHLAKSYRRAAEAALYGGQTTEDRTKGHGHFIDDVIDTHWKVAAQAPSRSFRSQADLDGQLDELPQWAKIWALYALGVQKTDSSDLNRRDRGLVQLASVAANRADQFPYITGLALDRLATELEQDGQSTSSLSLRRELQVQLPRHPIQQQIPPLQRTVADREKPQEDTQ